MMMSRLKELMREEAELMYYSTSNVSDRYKQKKIVQCRSTMRDNLVLKFLL
jgi:hypothetical protein